MECLLFFKWPVATGIYHALQCNMHLFIYLSYFVPRQNIWTQRYLYADSASAGYAVGAEVKPSIPGQKQVKYGAKCGDHFWLLCKPA